MTLTINSFTSLIWMVSLSVAAISLNGPIILSGTIMFVNAYRKIVCIKNLFFFSFFYWFCLSNHQLPLAHAL